MTYTQISQSPAIDPVIALYLEFDREFRRQFSLRDEQLSDLDLYPGETKGALYVKSAMGIDTNAQVYANAIGNVSFHSGDENNSVKLQKTVRNLDIQVIMTTSAEKGPTFVDSNQILNKLYLESNLKIDHGLFEITKRINDTYPWVKEISVLSDTWELEMISHKDDQGLWVVAIGVVVRIQWFLTQFPDGRHYLLESDTAPIASSFPNNR